MGGTLPHPRTQGKVCDQFRACAPFTRPTFPLLGDHSGPGHTSLCMPSSGLVC